MNTSWKDNNWILREAANDFPLKVVSIGKYIGPDELPETDRCFFHVGERLHGDNAQTKEARAYSYGGDNEAPLLAGYSDGSRFHILAYDSSMEISLACYKKLIKEYGADKLNLWASDNDNLANLISFRKMLKDADAVWTMTWALDEVAYEENKANKLEAIASQSAGWRDGDRKELHMFPTVIWEVTSIPLTDINFERRYDDKAFQEFVRKI